MKKHKKEYAGTAIVAWIIGGYLFLASFGYVVVLWTNLGGPILFVIAAMTLFIPFGLAMFFSKHAMLYAVISTIFSLAIAGFGLFVIYKGFVYWKNRI